MVFRSILLVLLATFLLFPIKGHAEDILLVTGEYPPYTSKEYDLQGPATLVVKAALEAAGVDVKIQYFPWKRCELMVQNGEAMATFLYGRSKERDAVYSFSDPIFSEPSLIFYRKDMIGEFDYNGIDSLHPLTMGMAAGYWYIPEFLKAGLRTEFATRIDQVFHMLRMGRVDAVVEIESVGWHLVNELFPEDAANFATANTPMDYRTFHLMASKRNPDAPEFFRKFNEGLRKLRESGELCLLMSQACSY